MGIIYDLGGRGSPKVGIPKPGVWYLRETWRPGDHPLEAYRTDSSGFGVQGLGLLPPPPPRYKRSWNKTRYYNWGTYCGGYGGSFFWELNAYG